MSRREVVFSARDEGVGQTLSQLEQSAQNLARETLQASMAQTQSAQKTVQAYEQQIKLIERRNKLDNEMQRNALMAEKNEAYAQTTTVAGRKQVDKDFAPKFAALDQASREDKQQTNILRDILSSIKDGTEDIMDNQVDVGNMSDERLRQIVTAGGAGQKSALHELRMREARGGAKGGDGPGLGALMSGRGLAALGIYGGLAAGLMAMWGQGFGAAREREVGLTDYSALSGQNNRFLSRYTGMGRGSGLLNNYLYGNQTGTSAMSLGFGADEYFSNIAASTRAYGASQGFNIDNDRVMTSLALQRGLGLDQGLVNQLERLTRTLSEDSDAGDTATRLFSAMYGTGAMGANNKDMSRMSEMLETYATFQESMFQRTGLIGPGNAFLNMRSRLEGMGGAYSRDDYAASTIESFNTGLSAAGGPESQAIKMDILRRMNPNMSYFELQAEMEKGIESQGFASGMIDFVKGTGGDLNSQAILLDQLTGGSMRKEDILNMLRGDMSFRNLDVAAETKDIELVKKAKDATSEKDIMMKNLESDWASVKEALFNISDMTTGMNSSLQPLMELLKVSFK